MPKVTKLLDATIDEVENAKMTAVSLLQNSTPANALDLFYTDNLEEIEKGIRDLNAFSNKAWILSALLLYTLVYNKSIYQQSGLTWKEYSKEARERLGLEPRDISDQLSAARFFIMNYAELERQGFNPANNNRKLARAEVATQLCGNVHETIKHLVNDTWQQFSDWYYSFKPQKLLNTEIKRPDIKINKGSIYIGKIKAVEISDKLPEEERERIENYIDSIFEAIRQGLEPAIVPCYDKKEANNMVRLRDKFRQGK